MSIERIEAVLRDAVECRCRPSLDDIDAQNILFALSDARQQLENMTERYNVHKEIADHLSQQLAEKDAEIERLNLTLQQSGKNFDAVRNTAAASQLQNGQLREALKTAGMNCVDDFIAAGTLQLADSKSDTSALEALIAKAGEVMRDRIIANLLRCGALGDGDYLNAIRALPGVTMEDIKNG